MRDGHSLARLEVEILEEKAAALGRIGRALETRIDTLQRLRRELPPLEGTPRAQHLDRIARLRDDVEHHFWYLIVQREALGLTDHRYLDRLYGFPRPEEPDSASVAGSRP